MKTLSITSFLAILLATASARAALPEPDNLLYGSISLDDVAVTAARVDVAVEVRRTAGGPAISRYQMGNDPTVGNFYSLRIPLESGGGTPSENASATGDPLFIVVTDASGVRAQAAYTVGERGEVLRLDFGAAVSDADGNGIADLWEIEHFGAANQNPSAINRNGRTTLDNFVAGTDPNDGTDRFQVFASIVAGAREVSFVAREASGPGYAGLLRFYTLEATTNLGSGPWTPVPGYINVPGNNQNVIHTSPLAGPNIFYRGTVRLQEEE